MNDLAYTLRNALKRPALSALIVVTLALGIGTNAAMFSVAYRVLFAPLPFADGERLVTLEQRGEFTNDIPWQPAVLEDLREQTTAFAALLGYVQLEYTLLGNGEPYFANVGIVNDDYFDELGVRPWLGRGFVPDDDVPGAAPVMLLGYDLWRTRFASDETVVGRSLEIEGIVYTVIGVLSPLPAWPRANAVWTTWAGNPILRDPDFLQLRSDVSSGIIWSVIGKLRPGATSAEAQREVDGVAAALRERWPALIPADYRIEVHGLQAQMRGESGVLFALLSGLSLLVLLIACANVANLHLARLAMRSQELAVREAMGANPARLLRQLLGESLLYAAAGGVLGFAIAWPMLRLLGEFAVTHTALVADVSAAGMLVPALSLALVSGLCSGMLAAVGRRNTTQALKEGGDKVTAASSGIRRRRALLVLQLALSFVMLTTAALMLLSLRRLDVQNPGYDVERMLTANFQLNSSYPDELQAVEFVARMLERIKALPEVEAAAVGGAPLLRTPLYGLRSIRAEGDEREVEGSVFSVVATEDYFSTLGIPLLRGRGFEQGDDATATEQAVIVNADFERTYFPAGALGRRLSFPEAPAWKTIVGVVGNVRSSALDHEEGPTVYTPFRRTPTSLIYVFVKSRTELGTLAERVSAIVHDIDARIGLEEVRPLEELRQEWLAPRTLVARLIMSIGVLALLISCSGVIGIVAYNVNQRVREIGVRVAVGATPRGILWMFMRQGLGSGFWGLLLGLLLMLGATSLIEPLLYQTTGFEISAYFAAALVLSLSVLVAIYTPAVRASRLDPVTALHHE